MFAGPNADSRDADRIGDLLCNIRDYNFQHNREGTGLFHRAGIGDQRFRFGLNAAFDLIAALLTHMLG